MPPCSPYMGRQWLGPLGFIDSGCWGSQEVLLATREQSALAAGVMWGWCQRNMVLYGPAQGHGSMVLGQPHLPARPESTTAAAPDNTNCGAPCSDNEAATPDNISQSGGPLPSASHPSLSTQVSPSGAGTRTCLWDGGH